MARRELSYVALLATGVAAFSLAGVLGDPLSRLRSALHGSLALLLIVGSERLGELCTSRPLWVVAGSVVVSGLCLHRAFGVNAFREMPFRPFAVVVTIHVLADMQGFGFVSTLSQKLYHAILRPPTCRPPSTRHPT